MYRSTANTWMKATYMRRLFYLSWYFNESGAKWQMSYNKKPLTNTEWLFLSCEIKSDGGVLTHWARRTHRKFFPTPQEVPPNFLWVPKFEFLCVRVVLSWGAGPEQEVAEGRGEDKKKPCEGFWLKLLTTVLKPRYIWWAAIFPFP